MSPPGPIITASQSKQSCICSGPGGDHDVLCKYRGAEYLKPFSLFSKSALCAQYAGHFIAARAPSIFKVNLV